MQANVESCGGSEITIPQYQECRKLLLENFIYV